MRLPSAIRCSANADAVGLCRCVIVTAKQEEAPTLTIGARGTAAPSRSASERRDTDGFSSPLQTKGRAGGSSLPVGWRGEAHSRYSLRIASEEYG